MSHFAVQKKSGKHCKSTILQLKKKKKKKRKNVSGNGRASAKAML